MIQSNPFKQAVLAILLAEKNPLGVHEIMAKLRAIGLIDDDDLDDVGLFRVNFLLMNALFQLRAEVVELRKRLEISSLAIVLRDIQTHASGVGLEEGVDLELQAYYLDGSNLENTTLEEIEELITGFWAKYADQQSLPDARKVLGISADASWEEIREAYRRAANIAHPDKGGDAQEFISLRDAYEALKAAYQRA